MSLDLDSVKVEISWKNRANIVKVRLQNTKMMIFLFVFLALLASYIASAVPHFKTAINTTTDEAIVISFVATPVTVTFITLESDFTSPKPILDRLRGAQLYLYATGKNTPEAANLAVRNKACMPRFCRFTLDRVHPDCLPKQLAYTGSAYRTTWELWHEADLHSGRVIQLRSTDLRLEPFDMSKVETTRLADGRWLVSYTLADLHEIFKFDPEFFDVRVAVMSERGVIYAKMLALSEQRLAPLVTNWPLRVQREDQLETFGFQVVDAPDALTIRLSLSGVQTNLTEFLTPEMLLENSYTNDSATYRFYISAPHEQGERLEITIRSLSKFIGYEFCVSMNSVLPGVRNLIKRLFNVKLVDQRPIVGPFFMRESAKPSLIKHYRHVEIRFPKAYALIETLVAGKETDAIVQNCCPICLDDLTVEKGDVARMKTCRHTFHRGCVEKALDLKPCCPICRGGESTIKLSPE